MRGIDNQESTGPPRAQTRLRLAGAAGFALASALAAGVLAAGCSSGSSGKFFPPPAGGGGGGGTQAVYDTAIFDTDTYQ